jgi:hypothetical protein
MFVKCCDRYTEFFFVSIQFLGKDVISFVFIPSALTTVPEDWAETIMMVGIRSVKPEVTITAIAAIFMAVSTIRNL